MKSVRRVYSWLPMLLIQQARISVVLVVWRSVLDRNTELVQIIEDIYQQGKSELSTSFTNVIFFLNKEGQDKSDLFYVNK